MTIILSISIVLFVIGMNMNVIKIKSILKIHGYKVNSYHGYIRDLINMHQLIKCTKITSLKRQYRRHLIICIFGNMSMFFIMICFFIKTHS